MIVENNKQLKKFLKDFKSKESIILPIEQDSNLHPQKSKLSLLYVNTFDDEYVLPINHNECLNIDLPNLKTKNKVYTLDRKKLLHFLDLDNVIDVSMMSYMRTGKVLELDNLSTNAHDFLNMKFYKKKNINTVIPVLKHIEKCRKISTMLQNNIEKYSEYVNVSYNDEILNNLSFIEKNGLMTTEGKVFSEYNLYTSTGRPSNRFGGINFAALNKKDGSRKKFISRFKNGVLVEMDFDAYHLRLIADKIGYDLPKGSVHEHMAQFYGVDYEEAKRLSFQYLYGYIPEDVIQINPYFSKVHDYIEELWNIYKNDDFVESDIYKRRIYKENLLDMNANKLFNYTIQLMETENNMKVLSALIPEIREYKSKLILYSYDSFLLDFNIEDGLDYLMKVKNILEQDKKYPVKVSWGLNYHDMEDITEKFV
tara:strand:- start:362 stop:1633 length:1272 start_codon:yes stop_codon:yes gene_type:complete